MDYGKLDNFNRLKVLGKTNEERVISSGYQF